MLDEFPCDPKQGGYEKEQAGKAIELTRRRCVAADRVYLRQNVTRDNTAFVDDLLPTLQGDRLRLNILRRGMPCCIGRHTVIRNARLDQYLARRVECIGL